MQINATHTNTVYAAAKPSVFTEQSRQAITLEAQVSVDSGDKKTFSPVVAATSQTNLAIYNGQQAQFVRFFSASENSGQQKLAQEPVEGRKVLSAAAMLYQQVDSVSNETRTSRIDESV